MSRQAWFTFLVHVARCINISFLSLIFLSFIKVFFVSSMVSSHLFFSGLVYVTKFSVYCKTDFKNLQEITLEKNSFKDLKRFFLLKGRILQCLILSCKDLQVSKSPSGGLDDQYINVCSSFEEQLPPSHSKMGRSSELQLTLP